MEKTHKIFFITSIFAFISLSAYIISDESQKTRIHIEKTNIPEINNLSEVCYKKWREEETDLILIESRPLRKFVEIRTMSLPPKNQGATNYKVCYKKAEKGMKIVVSPIGEAKYKKINQKFILNEILLIEERTLNE